MTQTTTTPSLPAPPPDPMTNVGAGLRALGRGAPQHPMPPAVDVRDLDADLAGLLDQAHTASSAAISLAVDWQRRTAGVQARTADATFVRNWLDDHAGQLPPDGLGPLPDHPGDQHARYVNAYRHEILADWLRVRAQRRAATITEALDHLADDLRDEMAALLTRARDDKSRGAYEQAMNEVAPRWLRTKRLWEWSRGEPWRTPTGRSYPGELELLEHEAATALGEQRILVPVEALRLPGAPAPKDAAVPTRPALPASGSFVNGEPVDTRRRWFGKRQNDGDAEGVS